MRNDSPAPTNGRTPIPPPGWLLALLAFAYAALLALLAFLERQAK